MRYSISNTAEYGDLTRGKRDHRRAHARGDEADPRPRSSPATSRASGSPRTRPGQENFQRMREEQQEPPDRARGQGAALDDGLDRPGVLMWTSDSASCRPSRPGPSQSWAQPAARAAAAAAASAAAAGAAAPSRSTRQARSHPPGYGLAAAAAAAGPAAAGRGATAPARGPTTAPRWPASCSRSCPAACCSYPPGCRRSSRSACAIAGDRLLAQGQAEGRRGRDPASTGGLAQAGFMIGIVGARALRAGHARLDR